MCDQCGCSNDEDEPDEEDPTDPERREGATVEP